MSAPNNFEASASWLHFDGAVVSMVLHAGGDCGRQAKENRVSFRNLLLASVIFWTCPLECFTHVPKTTACPSGHGQRVQSRPNKVLLLRLPLPVLSAVSVGLASGIGAIGR